MGFDQAVLAAVNGLAGQSGFLDGFVVLFTGLGIVAIGVLLLLTRRRRPIIAGILALVVATAIGELLNALTLRARPSPLHLIVPVSTALDSFPSGHTTAAFALAAALGWHDRRFRVAGYILAALVGLSRLYLGVHYPTDVLAGAALGTLAGIGTSALLARWSPRA